MTITPRNARYHVMLLVLAILVLGALATLLFAPGSASQKNWVVNNIIVLLTILLNLALSWRSDISTTRTHIWGAAWLIYIVLLTGLVFASQDFDTLVTACAFVLVSCVACYLYWTATSAEATSRGREAAEGAEFPDQH